MRKFITLPSKLIPLDRIRTGYPFKNKSEIILRDYLAMERTKLSNERTLLGYVRTALFFLTGGITLVQLREFNHVNGLGYAAISLSGVLLVIGLVRYFTLRRRLNVFYSQIKKEEQKINKNNSAPPVAGQKNNQG